MRGPWVTQQATASSFFTFYDFTSLAVWPKSTPVYTSTTRQSLLRVRGAGLTDFKLAAITAVSYSVVFSTVDNTRAPESELVCLNQGLFYSTRFGNRAFVTVSGGVTPGDAWGCDNVTMVCSVFGKNASFTVSYFVNCSKFSISADGWASGAPSGGVPFVEPSTRSFTGPNLTVPCPLGVGQRQTMLPSSIATSTSLDTLFDPSVARAESRYLIRAETLQMDLGLEAGAVIDWVLVAIASNAQLPRYDMHDVSVAYALVDRYAVGSISDAAASATFVDAGSASYLSAADLTPKCDEQLQDDYGIPRVDKLVSNCPATVRSGALLLVPRSLTRARRRRPQRWIALPLSAGIRWDGQSSLVLRIRRSVMPGLNATLRVPIQEKITRVQLTSVTGVDGRVVAVAQIPVFRFVSRLLELSCAPVGVPAGMYAVEVTITRADRISEVFPLNRALRPPASSSPWLFTVYPQVTIQEVQPTDLTREGGRLCRPTCVHEGLTPPRSRLRGHHLRVRLRRTLGGRRAHAAHRMVLPGWLPLRAADAR